MSLHYTIYFVYWDHKSYRNLIEAMDLSFLKSTHTVLHSISGGSMNRHLKTLTMSENSHILGCWDAGPSEIVTPNPTSYPSGTNMTRTPHEGATAICLR